MCTVSWSHNKDGYQLLFNRDERRTRKPAAEPRLAVRDGVRILAPADGDFGGTWIGTNEFGVSLCLLNGANLTGASDSSIAPLRSRGLFLLDVVPLPSVTAISNFVREADLSTLAPFTLAALEPGQPALVLEWNGSRKTALFEAADRFMVTSSSFDTEAVRSSRQKEYQRLSSDAFAFHYSHGPEPSAYSTCMHRPDAETVSFSWIRVSPAETDFFYVPAAPCKRVARSFHRLQPRTPNSGRAGSESIVRNSSRFPSGS